MVRDALTTGGRRRSESGVSHDHAKSGWERLNNISGSLKAGKNVSVDREQRKIYPQIVDVHVKHLNVLEETGRWVLEVQGRSPVVALIVLHTGRGTGGGQSLGIGHGHAERVSSLNSVDVT